MKNGFLGVLENYLKDKNTTTNQNADYFSPLMKDLPNIISSIIKGSTFKVKPSCGAGYKAEIPWICIFNTNITTSAKEGIYICYLFRSDMKGFYITLLQGITYFEQTYSSEKYSYANKVADYFRDKIETKTFSKHEIYLNSKGSLGYGYEQANIISKYYSKDDLNEEVLQKDLLEMLDIYNEIYQNMGLSTYPEIAKNVIENTEISLITGIES